MGIKSDAKKDSYTKKYFGRKEKKQYNINRYSLITKPDPGFFLQGLILAHWSLIDMLVKDLLMGFLIGF